MLIKGEITMSNIPTEELIKEVKRRESEEVPMLILQIEKSICSLRGYGYVIENDCNEELVGVSYTKDGKVIFEFQ